MCDRRLPCGCTEEDECSECSPWGPDRARLLPVLSTRERNAMVHLAFLATNPGFKCSGAGYCVPEAAIHVAASMATWEAPAPEGSPCIDFLIEPEMAMGLAQRHALRTPHDLAEDRRDWRLEMERDARYDREDT